MIFLADFSVIRPEPGLIFWSILIFLIFWFMVGKLAFKPIAKALKEREDSIQEALDKAKMDQEQMEKMNNENEKLLQKAREERGKILAEAKDLKNKIVGEAKEQAKLEANKIVEKAKAEIDTEKEAVFADLKNKVGSMALVIAEKVLEKNLSTDSAQVEYANSLVDNLNLN